MSAIRRGDQKGGIKKLSATYDFAIHTHGSIGPSSAVAEFRDGNLTSWSASQALIVAKATGEDVRTTG